MALLRADILTSIQYIILIILINMINQQALITEDVKHVVIIWFSYLSFIFGNRWRTKAKTDCPDSSWGINCLSI